MRVFIIFAVFILAVNAASDQELWANFKRSHGKTYKSLREEKLRYNIFQDTLREIETHNAKYENGESTYYLAINQFSDLTKEEFKAMLMKNVASKPSLEGLEVADLAAGAAPEAIDWRTRGAVLSVRNQGLCRSCWAFSAVGAIEGQAAIRNGSQIPLSEQQLVDCTPTNEGCAGGFMNYAFEYLMKQGLTSEEEYPYKAEDGKCLDNNVSTIIELSGYQTINKSETSLKEAVASIGPISVAVDASLWQSYGGGIYDDEKCNRNYLNHGVVAVGYGVENGHKYWIIKNSFGPGYGEDGYIRLVRDSPNNCGIDREPSYPVLK